jgi:hypothetical protein
MNIALDDVIRVPRFAVIGRCFPLFFAVIARCFSLLFAGRHRKKPRNSEAFARWPAVISVEEQRKQRRLAVAAVLP